ncbi:FAD-dependent oxidoreductase [Desulfocurvibacter africanus]|uniref:Glycerol-3-phosphate dehydrogenase n=1 Tax=Desulfocurvibacter africanus subsp. africanus str. Walvis Bay TaxID=690850 RepID=F3YWE3_DESAF|nr:FAD-dependent oxidoreductase [Desulfocurvibacter africanus]EGJ49329.1 Glycerol-3-phosphate dehydrogenase [Desulfocurvibacter africanus subsp. africanus str. Walvis Bay]
MKTQCDILRTQVLVIGGGVTGAGIMRDLALRGMHCVLVEKRDVNAGASGGNHGLLHSGARYVLSDPMAAAECREEGELLKRLAPQCIEDTGGLFVAMPGDDESYAADFPGLCAKAGIAAKPIAPAEALTLEPALSSEIVAAFHVPDASIDPFRLSLEMIAHARELTGCNLLRGMRVTNFEIFDGRIVRAHCLEAKTGRKLIIEPEQVVNVAGAWSGKVAALAGAHIPVLYSSGTLLVTSERIARRVINRLRPPADGDILVPGGTVSILGTTSVRIADPDLCRPSAAEVDLNIEQGARMIPALRSIRYIRAYSGVRPLLMANTGAGDDRAQSRGFALFNHEAEGLTNFLTVTGGKLTTFRLMAEKAADLVARRLGVGAPCLTRSVPLPEIGGCEWTGPGRSPRAWLARKEEDGPLLCECEMVSARTVDELTKDCHVDAEGLGISALGVRSRIGKGSCQGAFCGLRVTAHLYDTGKCTSRRGLLSMRDFFANRFKGQRPILWGAQMRQYELAEALHCGLISLEMLPSHKPDEVR